MLTLLVAANMTRFIQKYSAIVPLFVDLLLLISPNVLNDLFSSTPQPIATWVGFF